MIEFIVPGNPQGKGRPRVGRVGGHARMFTPQKTVAYESLISLAAQQALERENRALRESLRLGEKSRIGSKID